MQVQFSFFSTANYWLIFCLTPFMRSKKWIALTRPNSGTHKLPEGRTTLSRWLPQKASAANQNIWWLGQLVIVTPRMECWLLYLLMKRHRPYPTITVYPSLRETWLTRHPRFVKENMNSFDGIIPPTSILTGQFNYRSLWSQRRKAIDEELFYSECNFSPLILTIPN